MKIILIVLVSLAGVFILSQLFTSRATSNIEMYPYKVVKSFDAFEIRVYEPANFSYVTMDQASYEETSRSGFRALAGYIFGNNQQQEKIAMTSPVAMTMEDSVTMMFMVPAAYKLEDLPRPNDPNVKFKQEPEKYVAAIRFGGWANDRKIKKYTEQLKSLLKSNDIQYLSHFSYLGYNPPFALIGRRNEIMVEIDINSMNHP